MRNDPRLRCVAIERNKWYEKYVELEWNKQDSTAAYALFQYWDKLKQKGVEYVPSF
jgi:hypothetical protein